MADRPKRVVTDAGADLTPTRLLEVDRRFYLKGSPARAVLLPIALVSAEGDYLFDADGNAYLNFSAGLNTPCGSGDPEIVAAASEAALALGSSEDYATPQRSWLLERLARTCPFDVGGIQFYSSGTEAVEAALRFAAQASGGRLFVSLEGGYHGKTAHSARLSRASESDSGHSNFFQVPYRAPCSAACHAKCECALDAIDGVRTLLASSERPPLAAIVVEVVQGDAGVRPVAPSLLGGLQEVAAEHHGLFVVDEILTGMGRTGRWWACERLAVPPDIVTIGKGLANGYPISATVIGQRHAARVQSLEGGTSFGGNAISCAAALATLRAMTELQLVERAARIGDSARAAFARLDTFPLVTGVRIEGALIGISLGSSPHEPLNSSTIDPAMALYRQAAARGLLTTPGRGTIRLTPPLSITDQAIDRAASILAEALTELATGDGAEA